MYENYNSLGFFSNYFIKKEKEIKTFNSFENAVLSLQKKTVDPVSFLEIFSKGYCFADRTLIKDLYRSPWMAKPASNNSDWKYFELPKHASRVISENSIAEKFYNLLEEEMYSLCSGKKNIGILLSGGMDSRISAGILQNLLIKGKLNAKVTAITWGIENSRDIVYARTIAKRFEWKWEHINLNSKNLINNLDYCSEIGCETSPVHLHAIPEVRELNNLDCIITSSFGDSMGRGVFSSRHISKLKSTSSYIHNWYFLLKDRPYKHFRMQAEKDLRYYREQYYRKENWQILEIEQLSNYWRRMLNPCIGIINKKIPTYQTFSSPEVFSYIWSIDQSLRNDLIYSILIDNYIKNLSDIPWSKTGKIYNSNDGQPDSYLKEFHHYHHWINNELFDILYSYLNYQNLEYFPFINRKSLLKSIHINKQSNANRLTSIDQKFLWIVAVIKMIKKYNIEIDETRYKQSIKDNLTSYFVTPYYYALEKGIVISKKIR